MALSLLFKKEPGRIGNLELDARLDETHTLSNEVTQYPVEAGFDITDNVRNRPISFAMTGMVSNSPINYAELTVLNEGASRSQSAYDELLRLYYNKEIIDVQTTLELYQDMVIAEITFPRNNTIGGELRFTATFTQIIKARTEFSLITVEDVKDIENSAPEIDKRGVDKSDVGTQTTSEVKQSWLLSLRDMIGG